MSAPIRFEPVVAKDIGNLGPYNSRQLRNNGGRVVAIEHIHTYLVHPSKGSETPTQIGGVGVPLNGKLFRMLKDIYTKSDEECTIDISFNQGVDGSQNNPCRDLVTSHIANPTLITGRSLAERLASFTTNRSGLGLMFLILGTEEREHKIVLSRFPAHSAILAEEDKRNLSVAFLEKVFMKSATSYKAVAYQDRSLSAGFWFGRAVDKQINNRELEISNYWIGEFLDSDFRTTSAAGTRRLAIAMRDVARKSPDLEVKTEIAAAVRLGAGLNGQNFTVRQFANRFGLSKRAQDAIVGEFKHSNLVDERFRFDAKEFLRQVPYRTIELDSGAMLTAQSTRFDDVFSREIVDEAEKTIKYSTVGKVMTEKLEKSK